MTDLDMWVLVLGFFSPVVLSVIVQTGWSPKLQAVVAFIYSLVAGAIGLYIKGDFSGRTWVSTSLVILVTAIATYHGFWKPTDVADAIESRTNFGGSRNSPEQQVL